MNKVYIKFSSVTNALRAKEIIENGGGKAVIQKNINPKRNEGCGYSITVTGDVNKLINILKINKISYIGYELR